MYRILIVEDDRGIGEAIVRQASVGGGWRRSASRIFRM